MLRAALVTGEPNPTIDFMQMMLKPLPCLCCLLLGKPLGLRAVGFWFPHFDSFTSVMLLQGTLSPKTHPNDNMITHMDHLDRGSPPAPPVFERIPPGPAVAV